MKATKGEVEGLIQHLDKAGFTDDLWARKLAFDWLELEAKVRRLEEENEGLNEWFDDLQEMP